MHKLTPLNSFMDDRGVIEDLVVESIDAITRISFTPNAVRGNHFHNETFQWTLVIKGEIEASTIVNGVVITEKFKEGEFFVSRPGEPHAMQAIDASEILVFTRGPRSGISYQTDTQRIQVI
jgi:quercetin dioxygenase-like cupin family protein